MAIVYGLSDTGFVPKTLQVIREDLNAAVRTAFGSSIDLSDRSFIGQLIGIIAERLAALWELAEQIYSSQDPSKAVAALLEALCLLTGTFRPIALSSTVTLTLTGNIGFVIPSGSRARTLSTVIEFGTAADATLLAVSAWATAHTYVVGDRVTNFGNVYQCITPGTSAGSPPGPGGTVPDALFDGTCQWTFVGPGAAAADVAATSVDTGPIVGTRKDITVIVTPAVGWVGVTNLANATLGRNVATDEELRILRVLELSAAGNAPIDALVAQLLVVPSVTAVTVFENVTDATDADGVPPHAVESLVRGGADQDIYNALLANVAAGIVTHGTSPGSATDSQGITHVIKFSRPAEQAIYVSIAVLKDTTYPADGNAQVAQAIVDFGSLSPTGRDAVASRLAAQAFNVDGVFDTTETLIYTDVIGSATAWLPTTGYVATIGARSVVSNDGGRKYICITSGTSAGSGGPAGVSTDITDGTVHWRYLGSSISISSRQLATYATSHVSVTSTSGTP